MNQLIRLLRYRRRGGNRCSVAVGIALAGMWLFSGVAVPLAADGETPTVAVRTLIEALEEYKDGDEARLTAAERQQNAKVIGVARKRLSVPLVAERAFGERWNTLTEAQRNEFMELFSTLLEEKAYPKSSSFFADLNVEFLGESVQGDGATVETEVVHPKEGEITIDYRLLRYGGDWVIVDVVLDGASLAFDIRSQVSQVLVDDSFAALIQRMKERLAES